MLLNGQSQRLEDVAAALAQDSAVAARNAAWRHVQIEAAACVTSLYPHSSAQSTVATLAALEMAQADGRLSDRLGEAEVIALASAGRNARSRDMQEEASLA